MIHPGVSAGQEDPASRAVSVPELDFRAKVSSQSERASFRVVSRYCRLGRRLARGIRGPWPKPFLHEIPLARIEWPLAPRESHGELSNNEAEEEDARNRRHRPPDTRRSRV